MVRKILLAFGLLSFCFIAQAQNAYLAGYLIVRPEERVPAKYNAGFSLYSAAWPLLRHYPGHRFQTGLLGTWMFAAYDGKPPKDMYSDVEGGLGWWTDTRFPTEYPKFIMGGVAPNFSEIANGPGHGAGTWEDPRGLYGVAQLSSRILFPLDGLNLKQGTCGEFLGYGYLNLPLLNPKSTLDGKDTPVGGNCWTLFLNSANFKGPVAFFLPYFFAHSTLKQPELAGQLLDTRPMGPNMEVQMETQYIPCQVSTDSHGVSYARIAPTSYPRNQGQDSVLLQQMTDYDPTAILQPMADWFASASSNQLALNLAGSSTRTFRNESYSTWEIRIPQQGDREQKVPIDWGSFASPMPSDSRSVGLRWNLAGSPLKTSRDGKLVTLPEYFRLGKRPSNGQAVWIPVPPEQVPIETGLQKIQWSRPIESRQEPYQTPTDLASSWKTPGPKAGPFKAHLGDGTVVTYYWYRFADQPALFHANLTPSEREELQLKVEKLHKLWTKDRNYLAPLAHGKLANLDPALIVKPPKGLEIGYVPIAVKQE